MNTHLPGNDTSMRDLEEKIPLPPVHALLKASADPLRMQILKLLEYESFGVLELSQILDCKQSGMSHHLKTLAGAGLVTARREANAIFYQRAPEPLLEGLGELQSSILLTMNQLGLDVEVEQRVEDVLRARVATGAALFESFTDDFRELHDQVSPFVIYGKGAAEMLDACVSDTGGSVLEVGMGEGSFLPELSPRFTRVVGLDNSPAMLERAKGLVNTRGLDNIELLTGDTSHAWLQDMQFDVIVMNMSLHHVSSPAWQLIDIAGLLKSGGQFLLCDLCSHNQRSAREACGDVWLGFEEETLSRWAMQAGLEQGESRFLSQRNGLRVQLRQFCKPL